MAAVKYRALVEKRTDRRASRTPRSRRCLRQKEEPWKKNHRHLNSEKRMD
jgi:hypothetical protein